MFSRRIIIIIVCLVLLVLFRLLFAYHTNHRYHDREQVSWNTLLLSDINGYTNNHSFTAILPQTFPPQRVTIMLSGNSEIHYGQLIHISGRLRQRVLVNHQTVNTIYSSNTEVEHSASEGILLILYSIRSHIMNSFSMILSDIDSSLLLGIVFGIKSMIPRVFSQELQTTGVTHVIAASGMNVTMVAGFLVWFFGKYFPRRLAIALSIGGLACYALFAGLQSSIVRATIMGVCAFSAQLFGRQYHSGYVLLLTAGLMLLLTPGVLFDVGFQLSFLATLGIMIMQPLLSHKNILTEDLATTIAAQLATLPILLGAFGQYGLLSILVNGLVLWTIPPLMILGGLAAGAGFILPVLGKIFLFLAMPLLWYFEQVVTLFSGISLMLSLPATSPFFFIGYYLLLGSSVIIIKQWQHVHKSSVMMKKQEEDDCRKTDSLSDNKLHDDQFV